MLFISPGVHEASWICKLVLFANFKVVAAIYFPKKFSASFFSFSFWYYDYFHVVKLAAAAAAAKLPQLCPTLCDPVDSSPPGSPVPGILQARTLEWVAVSFSNA